MSETRVKNYPDYSFLQYEELKDIANTFKITYPPNISQKELEQKVSSSINKLLDKLTSNNVTRLNYDQLKSLGKIYNLVSSLRQDILLRLVKELYKNGFLDDGRINPYDGANIQIRNNMDEIFQIKNAQEADSYLLSLDRPKKFEALTPIDMSRLNFFVGYLRDSKDLANLGKTNNVLI